MDGWDAAAILPFIEHVFGSMVQGNVRLCGHCFSPVRDPQRFPVCPRCKELAGMLWGSD